MTALARSRVLISLFVVGCVTPSDAAPPAPSDSRPVIAITVGPKGYEPAQVKAPAGKPVRLTFTRASEVGCGQKLVIPSEEIEKDLPLGEPVAVDLIVPTSGEVTFTCGMGMLKGAIVAE